MTQWSSAQLRRVRPTEYHDGVGPVSFADSGELIRFNQAVAAVKDRVALVGKEDHA